ncbi:MAG: hypothetical protein PHI98_16130 [Eubacteriales bacterium]|nr:hypothetical protein [Eubacteriales bacterium]
MTMNTPENRRRRQRSDRLRQLYEARTLPIDEENVAEGASQPLEPVLLQNEKQQKPQFTAPQLPYEAFEPNEEPQPPKPPLFSDAYSHYTPNEPEQIPTPKLPDEMDEPGAVSKALPKPEQLSANLSAYYRMAGVQQTAADKQAYPAAPSAVNNGTNWLEQLHDEPEQQPAAPLNVYRPREVDWGQAEQRENGESRVGYQVEEEQDKPRRRRRKHHILRLLIAVFILALLAAGIYFYQKPLGELIASITGQPAATEALYTAVTTPAPIRGYDAATEVQISQKSSAAISQISGSLKMERYIVTETAVVTRNARADGLYDFYLFSATDGKLLAYYEAMEANGMIPLAQGGFYLSQSPYLITDSGSAMIRTAEMERLVGESLVLHPLINGWAIVSNENGTLQNYVNASGQLLSQLWFSKAYPMTGEKTLAYVDTGNLVDTDARYGLYVADAQGTAEKWRESASMSDVVATACGMVYFDSGELYLLNQLDAPLLSTSEVKVYVDCDAMVVRDSLSGKYGLFVHGEQHYDFTYDSIEPVSSDIVWDVQRREGTGGTAELYYVSGASYPQPLSHYFLLKTGDTEEYVALSSSSNCPMIVE